MKSLFLMAVSFGLGCILWDKGLVQEWSSQLSAKAVELAQTHKHDIESNWGMLPSKKTSDNSSLEASRQWSQPISQTGQPMLPAFQSSSGSSYLNTEYLLNGIQSAALMSPWARSQEINDILQEVFILQQRLRAWDGSEANMLQIKNRALVLKRYLEATGHRVELVRR